MSTVPGDPASVSACASTATTVARGLAAQEGPLTAAFADLAQGWPGRVSATTRRRGASLAAAAGTTAAELDRVATALQDHATDLADLLARARRVEGRAAAAGLEVRDGRVVPGYRGLAEADAHAAGERERTAAALQAELDTVLALHARRRDRLLGVLRTSGNELAAVSRALRRG